MRASIFVIEHFIGGDYGRALMPSCELLVRDTAMYLRFYQPLTPLPPYRSTTRGHNLDPHEKPEQSPTAAGNDNGARIITISAYYQG